MFDFSLGELLLVVVVAIVCIGPEDMPAVIRAIARAMRNIRELAHELKEAFNDLARESGLEDVEREIKREIRMIEGDDGEMYESYDMPETGLAQPKPKENKQ